MTVQQADLTSDGEIISVAMNHFEARVLKIMPCFQVSDVMVTSAGPTYV